ncbi:MAG: hypothetical protein U0V48_01875 [Anaerolineales bacterium]
MYHSRVPFHSIQYKLTGARSPLNGSISGKDSNPPISVLEEMICHKASDKAGVFQRECEQAIPQAFLFKIELADVQIPFKGILRKMTAICEGSSKANAPTSSKLWISHGVIVADMTKPKVTQAMSQSFHFFDTQRMQG